MQTDSMWWFHEKVRSSYCRCNEHVPLFSLFLCFHLSLDISHSYLNVFYSSRSEDDKRKREMSLVLYVFMMVIRCVLRRNGTHCRTIAKDARCHINSKTYKIDKKKEGKGNKKRHLKNIQSDVVALCCIMQQIEFSRNPKGKYTIGLDVSKW